MSKRIARSVEFCSLPTLEVYFATKDGVPASKALFQASCLLETAFDALADQVDGPWWVYSTALAVSAAKALVDSVDATTTDQPTAEPIDEPTAEPERADLAPELLAELRAAHQIIRNALALMTLEQKNQLARINADSGIDGEGATRANERQALIERAGGVR